MQLFSDRERLGSLNLTNAKYTLVPMKTMTVIFPPGRNVQEIILPLSHRQRNGTEPGIAT